MSISTTHSQLRILVVQPTLVWHSPELNIESIDKELEISADADVIILPEMWASGYTIMAHKSYMATPDCIKKMQDWAKAKNALVIGSLITKEEDRYYNRAYVVDSEGIQAYYDKRHLFGFAGEDRVFKAGDRKLLYAYKGWKLCINVCYDLRFPVWSRNTTDYDMLIYVANWPDKRISAWNTLLRARAIENQCYVIGSNCVGEDAWHNKYSGHSAIINPIGEDMAVLEGKAGLLRTEVDKDKLEAIRKTFPFLKDRDDFVIKNSLE